MQAIFFPVVFLLGAAEHDMFSLSYSGDTSFGISLHLSTTRFATEKRVLVNYIY